MPIQDWNDFIILNRWHERWIINPKLEIYILNFQLRVFIFNRTYQANQHNLPWSLYNNIILYTIKIMKIVIIKDFFAFVGQSINPLSMEIVNWEFWIFWVMDWQLIFWLLDWELWDLLNFELISHLWSSKLTIKSCIFRVLNR